MAAFFGIVETRAIWLSSLQQSNDYLEGKLIAKILLGFCAEDQLDEHDQLALMGAFGAIEKSFDGIALCLSEARDLLSQWRGYAADGTGVCIGFSSSYLTTRGSNKHTDPGSSFVLNQVQYKVDEHRELIRPVYEIAKRQLASGIFKSRAPDLAEKEQDFWEVLFQLKWHLYSCKSEAFSEEKEWRLVGRAAIKVMDGVTNECNFRVTGDKLIPYRPCTLIRLESMEPIVEVVVGPKNRTPLDVIERFLRSKDFQNVSVVLSSASYR